MKVRTTWPWISLLLIAFTALNPVGFDFIRTALYSGEQLSRNIAGPIVLMVLAALVTLALIEFGARVALIWRTQPRQPMQKRVSN
jgi:hypothetical protein